jgi:hypothetical protein
MVTAIGAAMPRPRLLVTAASATLPAASSRLPTTSRMRLLLKVVGLEAMTQRLHPSKLAEAGRHLISIQIKDDECPEGPKTFTHDFFRHASRLRYFENVTTIIMARLLVVFATDNRISIFMVVKI